MRLLKIAASVVTLVSLALAPAYAGGGSNSGHGSKPPAPAPSAHGKAAAPPATTKAPSAPKTSGATATKSKGAGPTAKGGSTKTAKTRTATPKAPKADAKAARVESKTAKADAKAEAKYARDLAKAEEKSRKADSKKKTGTSGDWSSSTTQSGTTAVDFTASPNGQKLTKNSALRSKLEARLEALGYTGSVYQAAYGFKNLGQFVAATNVSQNLGVSFEQLKLQMTGLKVSADGTILKASIGPDGKVVLVDLSEATKPAPTKSLGQSIQTVKAGVDGEAAAQTATTQADREISTTTAQSTTTAVSTTTVATTPATASKTKKKSTN